MCRRDDPWPPAARRGHADHLGQCLRLIGMKLAKAAPDTRKETAVPRPRCFVNWNSRCVDIRALLGLQQQW